MGWGHRGPTQLWTLKRFSFLFVFLEYDPVGLDF